MNSADNVVPFVDIAGIKRLSAEITRLDQEKLALLITIVRGLWPVLPEGEQGRLARRIIALAKRYRP
jgi:hypothetical protein